MEEPGIRAKFDMVFQNDDYLTGVTILKQLAVALMAALLSADRQVKLMAYPVRSLLITVARGPDPFGKENRHYSDMNIFRRSIPRIMM